MPSAGRVVRAAHHLARTLRETEPRAWLAGSGIDLRAYRRSLRLPGKNVFGVWDPLLRRIELHGCDDCADERLVATLAHEIWHALHDGGTGPGGEETAAHFARVCCGALGSARVRACADAIRLLAAEDDSPAAGGTQTSCRTDTSNTGVAITGS